MNLYEKVSTGLSGFDQVIDYLRFGDNVVWQVDSVSGYKEMVGHFAESARAKNMSLVYIRFADHEPLLDADRFLKIYHIDARKGFESFAIEIHNIINKEGTGVFYVFDCLTDLLEYWYSDLMIGNFFKATCPYLYELETVAYFAIRRNFHTYSTVAGIRETTQLLLDLYHIKDKIYIHPLKVWQRYYPTMFLPHFIQGHEALCITSSSDASELFNNINRGEIRLDHWNYIFSEAKKMLDCTHIQQEEVKKRLMHMLIGTDSRMFRLCDRYFTLRDILAVASREIGTGFIGGKSIGMLLARKILEIEGGDCFTSYLEPHDSFFIGSDVFTLILSKTVGGNFIHCKKRPAAIISMRQNLKKNFYTVLFQRIFRNSLSKCWNISANPLLLCDPVPCWKITLEMHLPVNMRAFSV